MENLITDLLFQTNAIQVCPEGEPFFYTSGKLGPYYVNTHYLYGSKEAAENLLIVIEKESENLDTFASNLFSEINNQYLTNDIYKKVIDLVCNKIKSLDFDYISGGERRDFYFSFMPANILKKPHISIMKDKKAIVSNHDFTVSHVLQPNELEKKKVLHIADLVTEASSYIRAWIPALKYVNAIFNQTISIVDRKQGGEDILNSNNIQLFSFAKIDKSLFEDALNKNYINKKQYDMLINFINDPDKFMLDFLHENPSFLQKQIDLGGKPKERALRCIENNYHKG